MDMRRNRRRTPSGDLCGESAANRRSTTPPQAQGLALTKGIVASDADTETHLMPDHACLTGVPGDFTPRSGDRYGAAIV